MLHIAWAPTEPLVSDPNGGFTIITLCDLLFWPRGSVCVCWGRGGRKHKVIDFETQGEILNLKISIPLLERKDKKLVLVCIIHFSGYFLKHC